MTTRHPIENTPEAKAERARRRNAESIRLRREFGIPEPPRGQRPRARRTGGTVWVWM